MASNKISPKVAAESNMAIQKQLKCLIYFEALTGVNRLYVLGRSKLCCYCVTTINFLLFLIATLTYNLSGLFNTSQSIYKNTQLTEYLILCICAVFRQKTSLEKFFRSLNSIDALLKIEKDIFIVTPKSEHLTLLFVICVCNVLDFVFSFIYYRHPSYNVYSFAVSYLTIAVNDIEVLFYCTLLGMILKRLRIIHAHTALEYLNITQFDKLTILAQKIKPDVTSLHKIYEMLQYSSSVLEKIIGFPILVMFTSCGIVTIMLLRGMFNTNMIEDLSEKVIATFQEIYSRALSVEEKCFSGVKSKIQDHATAQGIRYLWLYIAIKCIKHGIIILIPCYYGSLTIRQARCIRYALKRGLAVIKSDTRKRRQLKAFYQLTRDNEFAYSLWGYIHLNMALPLNYYYTCLTYFIIVVQFAKFFD